ncbi:MAG: hypothetical protein HFI43_01455 [Lachnospiraceae bacterium]|jgi:hypothetical protein|nr:hypothetical protein [Lachnospiraceae bacterium]
MENNFLKFLLKMAILVLVGTTIYIFYSWPYLQKYPQIELSKNDLYIEHEENLKDFVVTDSGLMATSSDPWISYSLEEKIPVKVIEYDVADINSLGGKCLVFDNDAWLYTGKSLKNGRNYIYIHKYLGNWETKNFRFDLVEVEDATIQIDRIIINSWRGILRLTAMWFILIVAFAVLTLYLIKILYKSLKILCKNERAFLYIKKLICLVISFISASFVQKYMRLPDNDFLWVLISLLLYYLFSKEILWDNKLNFFFTFLFSAAFSIANISGYHVVTNGNFYFGLMTENYVTHFTKIDFVGFIILTYVFYKGFGYVCRLISSISDNMDLREEYKKVSFEYCIVVTVFILISWLPYFCVYYPGFIFPDSLSSVYQALGEPLNNHHPIMYTLFIRVCLNVGMIVKDITLGCALYTLIQMVYIAFCLGYMICWLKNKGISVRFCMIIMVGFAFMPFIAQNSIAMWKDPIFSATILLWSLYLLDCVMSKGSIIFYDRFYIFKSCLLILIICFSRNNGFYLILFSEIIFIALLIIGKNKEYLIGIKKISASTGIILFCVYVITGPVYSRMGIADKPVESLGIFLNQMARVVAYEGKMDEEDKQFLDSILPLEKYPETYRPCVVDRLKWDEDFNQEYLNEHLNEFMSTYFSLLIKNPKLYIEAWILNTFGYWAPNYWEFFADGGNIEKGDLSTFYEWDHKGIEPKNLLGNIDVSWNTIFDYHGTTIYLAVINWLVLFLLVVIVTRARSYIIALAPSLGLIATLFIATPYVYWERYGLAEYYLLPVYLFILCMVLKKQRD